MLMMNVQRKHNHSSMRTCKDASLIWIIVKSSFKINIQPPHIRNGICKVVLGAHSKDFWLNKWIRVESFLKQSSNTHFLVTDSDVVMNSQKADDFFTRYNQVTVKKPNSTLISTEETCWIGHCCNAKEVKRFKTANITSNQRFMHSQYMGTRLSLLHMLEFGRRTGEKDDMRMIFEYVIGNSHMVTLDAEQSIFGTFAISEPYAKGPFTCWNTKCRSVLLSRNGCYFDQQKLCLSPKLCPLLWHYNGNLARDYARLNPSCRHQSMKYTKHIER